MIYYKSLLDDVNSPNQTINFSLSPLLKNLILLLAVCLPIHQIIAHGDLSAAIQQLNHQIEQAPEDAQLYYKRAQLYKVNGELDLALVDLHQALIIDPQLDASYLQLAQVYLEQNLWKFSIQHINNFIDKAPDNPFGYQTRAAIFHKSGDHSSAILDLRETLRLKNDRAIRPDDYLRLAKAILKANPQNYTEAVQVIEAGLDRLGGLISLQSYLLDLLLEQDNCTAALQLVDQIMEPFARKDKWLLKKAEILEMDGQRQQATKLRKTATGVNNPSSLSAPQPLTNARKATLSRAAVSTPFAVQASVIRGPYLQSNTTNSIIIKWRTDIPTDSKVWYGTDASNLNEVVAQPQNLTDHELYISGLSAGTTYYYAIGDNQGILAGNTNEHYFKTSPPAGSSQPLRAWILGDCGTKNNNARAVRDGYLSYAGSQPTDLILLLGDNAYPDGTDEEYQEAVFENMYENSLIHTPMWSAPGNHDYYSASAATQTGPYFEIFSFPKNGEAGGLPSGTEAYYSFDYSNIHFVSLDSHDSGRNPGDPQLVWLENDLAATDKDWIIVLFHHPPYSKGSHDSDDENKLRIMRENVLPILEAAGVDLVLSGHSHSYERSFLMHQHYGHSSTLLPSMILNGGDGKTDGNGAYQKSTTGPGAGAGAVYTVAGASGKVSNAPLDHPAMFFNALSLGSLSLEVDGLNLDLKYIDEQGAVLDYFRIQKDPPNGIPPSVSVVSPNDGAAFSPQQTISLQADATDQDGFIQQVEFFVNDVSVGIDDNAPYALNWTIPTTGNFSIKAKALDDDGNEGNSATITITSLVANTSTCAKVLSETDDAEQTQTGVVNLTSSDLELGEERSSGQTVGMRFIGLNIPQGAQITSAYLQFTVDETTNINPCELSIYGEDTDDADAFSPINHNISDRPYTDESITWSPPDWTSIAEAGPSQRSPNIAAIIQEIVDRGGYTSSSAIAIIIEGFGRRTAEAYDGNAAKAAELCVEYGFNSFDCPSLQANIGSPCDDGDPCTTGDVVQADCSCTGTIQDSDSDGICDANDICPGGPEPGMSCDDGDPQTGGETIQADCSCGSGNATLSVCSIISTGSDDAEEDDAGRISLSSSDLELGHEVNVDQLIGLRFVNLNIPQGAQIVSAHIQFTVDQTNDLDPCELYLYGQADDDPETFTNTIDNISDRPATNASVVWFPPEWTTMGDQGNAQQSPDISTILQEIVNRPGFSTNSAIVLMIDGNGRRTAEAFNGASALAPELCVTYTESGPTFDCENLQANFGDPCDDSDPCTTGDVIQADCSCAGTMVDTDNDGTCDANDLCNGGPEPGTPCDDGDPCTTGDVIQTDCSCVGIMVDTDNDGTCDANDICNGGPEPGTPCNDGDPCTTGDVIQADCSCAGTMVDTDNDGTCDANDICNGGPEPGTPCNDGDPCTTGDVIQADCSCAGTMVDTDNDGVCDANDLCNGGPEPGTPCDDGDPITDGETIQADCSCGGGSVVLSSCSSIVSSSDDAEENTAGQISIASSDLELGQEVGTDQTIGLRFVDLNIPQGAEIISAHLQFAVDETDNLNPSVLNLYGQADDDPETFANTIDNISDRPTTNASVLWSPPEWNNTGNQGNAQQSPDISIILQEIVNRPGFSSNSAIVLMIDGSGRRTAEAYNGASALAPELCVTYRESGPTFDCENLQTNFGDPCDDGDPCTTGDVIQADCSCAGTIVDSDNDGVCDANDLCNGSPEPGTSCDDGDPCTTGDVIQADCSCAGTMVDTDNDGTCDANDICNGGPEPGTSCDDGDPCTTGDVIQADCSCAGTIVDTDNDGTCDANDICNGGPEPGTPCDDGDPNTTGETVQLDCSCSGGQSAVTSCSSIGRTTDDAEEDSSGDIYLTSSDLELVNDGSDQTIGLRFEGLNIPQGAKIISAQIQFTVDKTNNANPCQLSIYGEASDNANTFTNDNHNISNRPQTANSATWSPPDWPSIGESGLDQQSVDISSILQEIVNRSGFNSSSSVAIIIDGSGRRTATSFNGNSSEAPELCVTYEVVSSDCPSLQADIGDPCDDGDPCTTGDVIQADCSCAGTMVDTDNDGTCDANDLCNGGPEPGTSCDDSDPCTTGDVIQADCSCAGTIVDTDNDGTCDANDICNGGPEPGTSCDDGDPCTIGDVIQADCSCAGTMVDTDNDGVCDANDICNGGPEPGTSCDDGDLCTIGDVIQADCSCAGTIVDTDNDGTCDANDICNGGPEPGTPCDDGDPDTAGETIQPDCSCGGGQSAVTSCSSIGSSTDDAEEDSSGDMYLTSSDLELVNDGSDQTIGLRFEGLNIPQGANIISAQIQFTVDKTNNANPCQLSIYGEASDDANTFTNDNNNISNRPQTANSAIWSPPDWPSIGESGLDQQSVDISSILQEIVNRSGFNSSSSVAIIIDGSGRRTATSFNGNSSEAPELCVTYEVVPSDCPSQQADIGDPCDDGDPCTAGDIVQADCSCAGILQDSDNDGTCDANDLCNGGPEPGTSCDDGDPCTTGDVIQADCSCAGTFADSDNDGVCDANDLCSGGPEPGAVCDDGDSNTTGETIQNDCSCGGGVRTFLSCSSINSSNNDAEEKGAGNVNTASTDMELVLDGSNQTVGLRFVNLNIPQGAIITSAYIQFTVDRTNNINPCNLTIYGEASDNPAFFTSSSNNITNRLRTASTVSWSPPDWQSVGEAGPAQQSTDIAPILQEIVDRNGYTANSAIVIIIDGIGRRTAKTFNANPAEAPELCVEYEVPGSALPETQQVYQALSETLDEPAIFRNEDEASKSMPAITIYPNPTRGKLTLSFLADREDRLPIQIRDARGQVCYQTRIISRAGRNEVVLEDLALPSGVYYLQMYLNGARQTAKFINMN